MTSSPEQKPKSHKNIVIALLLSAIFWLATELWMKPKMPPITQNTPKITTGERIWPYTPSQDIVILKNPHCEGFLDCRGAVLYQWNLKDYYQNINNINQKNKESKKKNPFISLLSPEDQCFSLRWYSPDLKTIDLPTSQSLWKPSQEILSQDEKEPLILTWTNKDGLIFSYRFQIDKNYILSVEQSVKNTTNKNYTIGVIGEFTRRERLKESMMHCYEGPLGVFQGKYQEIGYKSLLSKETQNLSLTSSGSIQNQKNSWMGFSDKYWLSAIIPQNINNNSTEEKKNIPLGGVGAFSHELGKTEPHTSLFVGQYQSAPKEIKPGEELKITTRVFLGPKVLSLLESYEKTLSIDHFDLVVDFGWFYFLTKPFLQLLSFLKDLFGNFGLAILVMTVLVKGAFFPLSLRSHRSMMQMKAVQPKIDHLRQIYSNDKMRLNQEIMALYKKEKLSPASGCLPMILQMPVFFALYKVFSISIEMRQAPFWGWVQDMSLPDPTSIFNLFGLFSFNVPFGLSLGAWPLLMGLTMFIQQKKQMTGAMDPHQRMMLLYFMPLMFMGFMAQLPVGLVIYSTWNNILTMAQQSIMMHFFSTNPKELQKAKRLDYGKKTLSNHIKDFFSKKK